VGRGHVARLGLDRCRVALILLQLIEADKMPTGAVQEEAEELVEEDGHRKPFRTLAHRAEQAIEVGEKLQVTHVTAEQSQAASARQRVGCDLNTIEQRCSSIARGERFGHDLLAPFGLRAALTATGYNFLCTSNLTQRVPFFYLKNRSV